MNAITENTIEYEVYGYDQSDKQDSMVCETFAEAKKEAHAMKRRGLVDIKMTKTDGWDLYHSWEFVNGKFKRTE